MTLQPLLTSKDVAGIMRCHPGTVFAWARAGRIPAPIDATLTARMWRWSPQVIAQYIAGEWKPEAASRT